MHTRRAAWQDLNAVDAYTILQLRSHVFVLEQDCVYHDPDGLDLDPGTEHVFIVDKASIAAYLRVLPAGMDVGHSLNPAGRAIGRVVTDFEHRRRGLAGSLLETVIDSFGSGLLTMHAQSHLLGWYEKFGFRACGPEFLDDGIAHTPLQRLP